MNGERLDASDMISEDANLEIITAKDEDGLEIIRLILNGTFIRACYQATFPKCEDGYRSNY